MATASREPIVQVGYVVDDLDAGIKHWIDTAGMGPWTVFRGVTLNGTYLGQPTTVTMHVAMGYSGETQIELMEITSDTPSPYADADGKPLLGPHHVAWLTDDLDVSLAEAKAAGQEVLFQAEGPGTRVAYVHSPTHPGPIFEYIQTDGMREMIKYGIEQTRNWDGTDPVRELG
ncbi:VOC family protein [Jongsikchunia kroppenstedtii]|uniref:VOC family protein n=1 Tax=Jongsikchunia kroppenstedtii TaxID=1121721 RepID=UPI000370FF4E|nr:VOC family protein [Jongsikchunia kroppenstedtii]